MGTSFPVAFPEYALTTALTQEKEIVIVDPLSNDLTEELVSDYSHLVTHHKMTAQEYIKKYGGQ